jgi:hypothetical protein
LTPSEKIKRASASITVEWISKDWKVTVNIIPKSFLKCYLSNVEDGTQDNIFGRIMNKVVRVHHLQKIKV